MTEDHTPHGHTPSDTRIPSSNTSSQVCRQLSGAFTSAQTTVGNALPSGEDLEDPLQCSTSGSVFAGDDREEDKGVGRGDVREENKGVGRGDVREGVEMENTRVWYPLGYAEHQPASPQVAVRGCGHPAPLPSTQSSVESSLLLSRMGQLPRRTSAPARTTSWSSAPFSYHGNTAPLSPLAAGRKSRTPSGKGLTLLNQSCWTICHRLYSCVLQ